MAGGKEKLNRAGGFWQIINGVLILTVTNNTVSGYGLSVIVSEGTNYTVKHASGYTNFDLLPPGEFGTNSHKLVRIDDREMVYNWLSMEGLGTLQTFQVLKPDLIYGQIGVSGHRWGYCKFPRNKGYHE